MNKPSRYTKSPITVDAIRWTGDNKKAIKEFCPVIRVRHNGDREEMFIPTYEGIMMASVGDWIIKGAKGEFYPCKPDVFAEVYLKDDLEKDLNAEIE